MKTPEAIKKGLECIGGLHEPCIPGCPYEKCCECGLTAARDAIELIQQLESTISQVNKVLCGKENATLEEVLQAVYQVKKDLHYTIDAGNIMKDEALKLDSRLAQVERERDAALKDIANTCWSCGNAKTSQLSKFLYSCPHLKGKAGVRTQCEHWQWRGVCPENTKEG